MNNDQVLDQSALEQISRILEKNVLPDEPHFLEKLQGRDGSFSESESVIYDYKEEYPFSNSDPYFGGILRLICAFHNTFGGLILFGINDASRLAGKNKVKIDSEKINRRLREALTSSVEISHRSYETTVGVVDVILVPKRKVGIPPVRLKENIGGYSKKKIYLRRGAEVLDAAGADLEFLYGPRLNQIIQSGDFLTHVDAALPASPATLAEFVGRFDVVESLMNWLTGSRDPRFFLWGAGGSGKSTIAYEFARIVASIGRLTHVKNGKPIDRVIYLTAKKLFLDPFSAKIETYTGTDFENAKELFRAILDLSNFTDSDLSSSSEEQLVENLEELFEIETQLIVIDDIDTLVSSNEDLGMEQLFNVVARCNSGTKILYTQRNLPSYARKAALEVPGLDAESEFPAFCEVCCDQFRVPAPTGIEKKKIEDLSELRPLAVETMIGLRRITSNYEDALSRWRSDSSEAREYLFQREYERLSAQNRGRHFLATLAAFGKPQQLDSLKQILMFSDEQMQDAISETRDIFLKVEHVGADKGDLYSLGAATQSFVEKVSTQLERYESIKARVRNFTSATLHTPPPVLVLLSRAERNIEQGQIESAISLLSNSSFPATVTEHPSYKAVLGIAYSKLPSPRLGDARVLFREAFMLGHRDHKMFLSWVEMEIKAGSGGTLGIEVCELVAKGSGFQLQTVATFHRRLAYLQVGRAMEVSAAAPDESADLWKNATLNNTRAYLFAEKGRLNNASSYFDQFSNSFDKFCGYALRTGEIDDFFEVVESILSIDTDVSNCLAIISNGVLRVSSRIGPHQAISLRRNLNRLAGRFSNRTFCMADAASRADLYAKLRDLIVASRG